MAAMDYCYYGGERCRYIKGPDSDTRWLCLFHAALEAKDKEAMKRELTDPEHENISMPAGMTLESIKRRRDGSYAVIYVARPNPEDDISHPILNTLAISSDQAEDGEA